MKNRKSFLSGIFYSPIQETFKYHDIISRNRYNNDPGRCRMDGVFSGLTSIVPIIPDHSTITDRSGVSRPPVEIMPLPTNSFMSDDMATELLKNPFTLSLDKNGHNDGGDKAVGGAAPQAGRSAADALLTGDMLEEAYTLSLGNEESAPVATEIASEMIRMKEYERLGRTAGRRSRKNPGTGNNDHASAQPRDDGNAKISDKVRNLLSRFAAQQNEAGVPLAAHIEVADIVSQTQDAFLLPPETLEEDATTPRQAIQPGGTPEPTGARQEVSLLSNFSVTQFSASDIEFILTLEPELREALLNMLGTINPDSAAASEQITEMMNTAMTLRSQPGSIQQTMIDSVKTQNAANAGTALLADEEMTRLAAEVLVSGRTRGAPQVMTLSGSMDNLRKVHKLPYSLYIFGNVSAERRVDTDEDIEFDVSKETSAERKQAGKYLRLSEAVKMAAVLHHLYYGGNGRFPVETPWYTPYVRYAIKNGIIKDNDFGNYNEYATRAETAYIFSNCVPKAEFPILNYISEIPDVLEALGYGASIYLLYRAGILKKNGRNANFYPEQMMVKSEAAMIIGRIATPEDRKLGYTAG